MDSRSIGSLLSDLAKSSWKANHSEVHAPAELPVEPMRVGSMFHSFAFERIVCSAGHSPSAWLRFHGRLDILLHGLGDKSIVDRSHRNTGIEEGLNLGRSIARLVAADPTAAVAQ